MSLTNMIVHVYTSPQHTRNDAVHTKIRASFIYCIVSLCYFTVSYSKVTFWEDVYIYRYIHSTYNKYTEKNIAQSNHTTIIEYVLHYCSFGGTADAGNWPSNRSIFSKCFLAFLILTRVAAEAGKDK